MPALPDSAGAADIAAMVGIVGPAAQGVDPGRWQQSVRRLQSRATGLLTETVSPRQRCAFRGSVPGFFTDGRYTVIVDGTIDNLDEIAVEVGCLGPATGAERVATFFGRYGEKLFERLTGAFSLVVADHAADEIYLVRDRFGTRPLFYTASRSMVAWASEIKFLTPLIGRLELDREGVRQAIHYRYVFGNTMLAGVSQVPAACFARLTGDGRSVEVQYWRLVFRPDPGGSLEQWADRTDEALDVSFSHLKTRCRSVGILLSGGVDSSLLALKAANSGFRNCVALTARWHGSNPELDAATAVARHLGLEHRIVDLDDSFITAAFPWLVWRLEEPPRHYNSFVLAKLLQAGATDLDAMLSGHAADALFGPQQAISMSRFRSVQSRIAALPAFVRHSLAHALPSHGPERVKRWKNYCRLDEHQFALTSFRIDYGPVGDRLFDGFMSNSSPSPRASDLAYIAADPAVPRFQRFDMYSFNQSHLSVFDRCGAPLGANVALPFIAPEMVKVAEQLPENLKASDGVAKPVLKCLAARHFPGEWIYRRKQGFPTATTSWIRGLLQHWRSLLEDGRAADRGIVDVAALRHADIERDFEAIWTCMTLELFCRQFMDGDGDPAFVTR